MRRIVSDHAACCADRARGRRADQHLGQLRCAVAELAVPAAPYFPGGQEAQAEAQNQLGDALRRLGGGDPDKIAAAASAVIFRACAEPPPPAAGHKQQPGLGGRCERGGIRLSRTGGSIRRSARRGESAPTPQQGTERVLRHRYLGTVVEN